ncbi:hypothetical protein O9H85_12915 [Paenibacillus filicis]|uniref:Pyridoxamine 5'-phosphate oxidase putative domain-containing protein n=1 Tax=Paenibacillus gyeongsangnamensis TaxID=3388067 RepID=A0ABT4Q9D3_9BACL|nr:hypothetical protein [Paenibacillus filicis]MCZ8513310.1 hypothetical protein [Paenibacillus filicis]
MLSENDRCLANKLKILRVTTAAGRGYPSGVPWQISLFHGFLYSLDGVAVYSGRLASREKTVLDLSVSADGSISQIRGQLPEEELPMLAAARRFCFPPSISGTLAFNSSRAGRAVPHGPTSE